MADETNDTNEQRDDEQGGKRTLFKAFCKWLDTDEGKRAAKGLDLADEDDAKGDEREQEDDDDANGIDGVELSDIDTMLAEVFADAASDGDFDPREDDDEDDEEHDDDPKREAARVAGVRRATRARPVKGDKGTSALASAVAAISKGARSARKGR